MAKVLYSIGRFAARRAWIVIIAWLVVIAALAGAYTTFKGELSNSISIPGTQTQQLQDELSDTFDMNADAGTGQVILQTKDGQAITAQEKQDVARAVSEAKKVDGVDSVTNPFEQQQQVQDGQAKLDQARPQITQGQRQLDQAQQQLDRAPASPQREGQQKQLDQKKTEFQRQKTEFQQNEAKLKLSSDYRSVSEDGSTALVTVNFTDNINSVAPETLQDVRDQFSSDHLDGLKATYDQNLEGVQMPDGKSEMIGVVVAMIILFIMLGTFVAAGLPILMAIIGVMAAYLGAFSLSGVLDMQSSTLTLGSMLGLAVGIDYSLFILNRHRNNLAQGYSKVQSIALATGTSGNAVLFAGTTVIIALLALNVVGIPFLSLMGNVAAFAVLLAVLIAVTLTPAVLGLAGMQVVPKKRRARLKARHQRLEEGLAPTEADQRAHEEAERREVQPRGWLKVVTARPVLTIAAVLLALGLIAVPVGSLRLGLPDGSSQPADSGAHQSFDIMTEKFGKGRNSPMIAAVQLPAGTTAAQAKQDQVDLGQQLKDQEDVSAVVPVQISRDNSTLLYQITPEGGPSDESTSDLVTRLRDTKLDASHGQASVGVAGQTAMNIDVSQKLQDVLPVYLLIVIGLSFLVLVLVFRSVLVPLTATIGFLFSLLAAFGATVAVFQWGWMGSLFGVSTPGPVLSFLPIIAVGILFGLAMDYQVFLVSAMRESFSHGRDGKTSVVAGFNASSKVVLTAALIMTGVFLGFVFSGDPMTTSIGFVLAAGVLLDAFVIRMTLIPALMYLMAEKAWWFPKWLDKIVPDMDVEGASLERGIGHADATGSTASTAPAATGAAGAAAATGAGTETETETDSAEQRLRPIEPGRGRHAARPRTQEEPQREELQQEAVETRAGRHGAAQQEVVQQSAPPQSLAPEEEAREDSEAEGTDLRRRLPRLAGILLAVLGTGAALFSLLRRRKNMPRHRQAKKAARQRLR